MKKLLLFVTLFLLNFQFIFSQTLFTYGKKSVSKQAFLQAFNKNPSPDAERRKALDEYLNLYINYKLKVQAAVDEGLDKQPSYIAESNNFKNQIAENIINDEVGIKKLIQEAFIRSQKDVFVAQVYVPFDRNGDTSKAYQQIMAAYSDLKAGKDFETVTTQYSSDESIKAAKGNLGYVTAFSFTYNFENEVYCLSKGQFGKPFKSNFGYHIFKNVHERKALGKRKVAQILIATPPNGSATEKAAYKKTADSLYEAIIKGAAFDRLAVQFSDDKNTAGNGGIIGDVGIGNFEPSFEAQIFALEKMNDVSKPFETAFGYHIIKLLDIIPAATDSSDAAAMATLQSQVENDERLYAAKKAKVQQWLQLMQYKPAVYNATDLWAFTDSSRAGKTIKKYKSIQDSTVLFTFDNEKVYVKNWLQFLISNSNGNNYTTLMKDFVEKTSINHYKTNLYRYNKTMQQQSDEFNEANLLFAAMDKHVWGKAGENADELQNYFQKNASQYQWQLGFSAVVITTPNEQVAKEIIEKMQLTPKKWRDIATSFGNNVIADSNRYEWEQQPIQQKIKPEIGFISTPEKNNGSDQSYTFLYVTAIHTQKQQRAFEDARGLVMNNYQQVLEQKWLSALKKKYPVTINTAVWKTIQ
ncbi:MAG: peptidylprolyl isomerase [Chitinophagaceae bacterium]